MMKPQDINKRIAKFIGLKPVCDPTTGLWSLIGNDRNYGWRTGLDEDHCWRVCCPDFNGDLNAMAVAEQFLDRLPGDLNNPKHPSNRYAHHIYRLHYDESPFRATAATRASAFLIVIDEVEGA